MSCSQMFNAHKLQHTKKLKVCSSEWLHLHSTISILTHLPCLADWCFHWDKIWGGIGGLQNIPVSTLHLPHVRKWEDCSELRLPLPSHCHAIPICQLMHKDTEPSLYATVFNPASLCSLLGPLGIQLSVIRDGFYSTVPKTKHTT